MTQVLFDGVTVPYVPQRDIVVIFTKWTKLQQFTYLFLQEAKREDLIFRCPISRALVLLRIMSLFVKRSILDLAISCRPKLSFEGNVNYSNEKNENPPNVAQQDNTIPVVLYNMANSMPLVCWRKRNLMPMAMNLFILVSETGPIPIGRFHNNLTTLCETVFLVIFPSNTIYYPGYMYREE